MLYRDLIDRYAIKNEYALRFFIKRVMTGDTKELTISRIFNDLKSQNIKLSKDLLYDFSLYLQDIYFTTPVANYHASIKGVKKIYLLDRSFLRLLQRSDDIGQRLENTIFSHIRKKYEDIFFLRTRRGEIDFFIPSKTLFIQVTKELSYENEDREIRPLLDQEGERWCILMDRTNRDIEKKYPEIQFISVIDYLLEA